MMKCCDVLAFIGRIYWKSLVGFLKIIGRKYPQYPNYRWHCDYSPPEGQRYRVQTARLPILIGHSLDVEHERGRDHQANQDEEDREQQLPVALLEGLEDGLGAPGHFGELQEEQDAQRLGTVQWGVNVVVVVHRWVIAILKKINYQLHYITK